jgi:spore maturation protein SpmA
MALNYIWVSFFLISFVVAMFKLVFLGDIKIFPALVTSTFETSKMAFEICLYLTGVLSFWMGLMKVGENAGMVKVLARVAGPFFSRLFPDVPPNHPAMAPMLMNFSANLLGLDNAGTPLGLKAMQELQKLNKYSPTASNAQIMFLVINTSGLTLIPITIIMYRAQLGSEYPSSIFIPILLATICSTLAGLILVAFYQKINLLDKVLFAYLGGVLALVTFIIYAFSNMDDTQVTEVSTLVGNVALFSAIVAVVCLAVYKKENAYEAFIEGAKDGFGVAINIIPYLVAMLVGIGLFRASGALESFVEIIRFFIETFGIDSEFVAALPTALMKPLSGSGARGMMIDAMNTYGADSFIGKLACTFQGSTDTTLYIVAVYFGSVSVRNTRYAITCGLFADLVGIITSVLVAYIFYK